MWENEDKREPPYSVRMRENAEQKNNSIKNLEDPEIYIVTY